MTRDAPVIAHEQQRGGIWTFTLNSPGNRNAMSTALTKGLVEAYKVAAQSGAKAIFLRSSGPAFCSGADLRQPQSGAVDEALQLVAESPVPWVACVEGPAVGAGAALAGLCVVGIVSTDAWFALPEIDKLGRFPVGVSRWLAGAVDMRGVVNAALRGTRIDAAEAARMGWGTVAASGADFEQLCRSWEERLVGIDYQALAQAQARWVQYLRMSRSPLAVRSSKDPMPRSSRAARREQVATP